MAQSGSIDYQTFSLGPNFRIVVDRTPHFSLSDDERRLVEEIWQEEQRRKGSHLFNGRILCYSSHDTDQLVGYFIDYKDYIAVRQRPALREKMPINLLGASGLTIASASVLWGKRASFVTAYPGYYECAPSGGLNPEMVHHEAFSPHLPFEMELLEETGLAKESIKKISVRSLVHDSNTNLYELVGMIELDEAVLNQKMKGSHEYDELLWIEISNLPAFFASQKEKILPMSAFLCSRFLKKL